MGNDKAVDVLNHLASFFTSKLEEHGCTPQGLDFNSEKSQRVRFEQLIKVVRQNEADAFTVNDLGCGYGAFYDYLRERYPNVAYTGFDISAGMIDAAQARHRQYPNVRYVVASEPKAMADYGVASGIFNLRFGCGDAEWRTHIEATLDVLDRLSRRGFVFNCLTSYSDADKMRDDLYYADPCALFDLCKRRYSRNVALLHDYELYDFTILVRKYP
jgi:SAM-dependent methyltransferase